MRQRKGMSTRERRRQRQGTPGRPLQRTPRRRRTGPLGAIVLAALACCLLPSAAAAKHVIAPPGNAGVEQYVEVVPGAAGNEPVDGHSGKGDDALSQSTEHHLQALGPEGEAAAAFAQATGSAKAHRSNAKHGKRPHHGSSATSPAGGGGGNGGGSAGGHGGGQHLTKAAGGGIGIGLPLALALIALLALAGALLRRRSLPS